MEKIIKLLNVHTGGQGSVGMNSVPIIQLFLKTDHKLRLLLFKKQYDKCTNRSKSRESSA